ncbi:uncharacterized protein SCHCODRAFT_02641131 [Schizophyllum commune H4-8]|uniref:uncharacterized protein n=1 Tax=Schizophyllum commune (strain H4-8 / FGSC 9210) TaxID=578458 RepID=UPI00215F9C65|nr:uncharacterized protein SCHCODRAFT_02641131 [Schizophyllum commune H4-8]KAI5887263.1 hypothetical protein SCHCODRAFT_02641131 [Schizophyllum commune H4-8]
MIRPRTLCANFLARFRAEVAGWHVTQAGSRPAHDERGKPTDIQLVVNADPERGFWAYQSSSAK